MSKRQIFSAVSPVIRSAKFCHIFEGKFYTDLYTLLPVHSGLTVCSNDIQSNITQWYSHMCSL